MRKSYWLMSAALLVVLSSAQIASAKPPQDDSWLAWVGCWRPDGGSTATMLCIIPDGDGVKLITLSDKTVENESRVVADNQARKIDTEGCSGTDRAHWSADGQRVFINAELLCGKNASRKVSGMFAMLTAMSWVSVQTITSAGTSHTETVRYVEAHPSDLPENIAAAMRNNRLARETIRLSAASMLDLADVREAVKNVDASVVEAWLTATAQGFKLNGKTLVSLADAGVPASVIDVLVAVSNPAHFAVRQQLAEDDSPRRGRRPPVARDPCPYGFASYASFYDPFGYRRGQSYYDRNGYNYGCGGYGGYGGGYYGGFGGGYYGGPVIIVKSGGDDSDAPTHGKVTRSGYTSGRSGSDSGTATDRTAKQPNTTTAPASTASTGSSSSGSSSSGTTHKAHAREKDN